MLCCIFSGAIINFVCISLHVYKRYDSFQMSIIRRKENASKQDLSNMSAVNVPICDFKADNFTGCHSSLSLFMSWMTMCLRGQRKRAVYRIGTFVGSAKESGNGKSV